MIDAFVYQIILHFITAVTLLSQAYLTYLVQTKSPQTMNTYKYYLNSFTFYDMWFTIILGVFIQAEPVGALLSGRFFGLSRLIGPRAQILCLSGIIWAGSNMLLCQVYCIIYRFTIVLSDKHYFHTFISKKVKILITFITQIFSIGMGFFAYHCCVTPEAQPDRLAVQPPHIQDLLHPGEFIVWLDLASNITKAFFASILVMFLVGEVIFCILLYKILKILRANIAIYTKNTYKLNMQFTLLLLTQLMMPPILVMIPVSITMTLALNGQFAPRVATQIGLLMISLYGFTNTILSIFFIAPYRSHFFNVIVYPWLRPTLRTVHLDHLLSRNLETWSADAKPMQSNTFVVSS